MATKRLRMEEAYEYVKSKRKIISPNFNFMGQLLGFETQVFSPANPSRNEQVLVEPLSPLMSRMSSSTGFCFEKPKFSPTARLRGNSAPSSPSTHRTDCQRLVFDFTQVPNNTNTSVKSSQLIDSSVIT